MEQRIAELRLKLIELENMVNTLTIEGAVLTFDIASEHKAMTLKTEKVFSMTVKATINQEL